ncbi:MAG: acetylglutamate kinase [Bacteroidota bacterium]
MQALYIIKIGGNIINHEVKLKHFISLVSTIKARKIIVHGGGKLVDELALKLGIEQQMIDGRRVTDTKTLELTTMVYAGLINKKIVALLQANSNNAIGLSGADNNCIRAKKRTHAKHSFGWVGDIEEGGINTSFISTLLEINMLPVFCSITHDKNGQLLNTNADTLASALAVAMSAKYKVHLNYCFEKKGVMADMNDDSSVIPTISASKYKQLVKNKLVSAGMIPKLDNAFAAVEKGVSSVVILHADDILNVINNNKNVGTQLIA